jgi:integrase
VKTKKTFKRQTEEAERWPMLVRAGNVAVRVYRLRRETSRGGTAYVLAWRTPEGRKRQKFSCAASALEEARLKAAQLNAGRIEASNMTGADRDELETCRELARAVGMPLVSLVIEAKRVHELTKGHAVQAAEAWAARNIRSYEPITLGDAIDQFIRSKNRAGKQGTDTYERKLKALANHFGRDVYIDTISAQAFDRYLAKFENGAYRNDQRKRMVALSRWAQRNGHLPHGVPLEAEATERAPEAPTEIGILSSHDLSRILEYTRSHCPEYLGGLAVAAFCGLRPDELQGRKANRELRQVWEDVFLDREPPFVRVTIAKTNTASWRNVPICEACREWLLLCPQRKGPILPAKGMEKLRWQLRHAKDAKGALLFPNLPDNCFRHSYITYRVVQLDGNKHQVADEAGNSVAKIDRHYRRPVQKAEGEAWFAVRPQRSDGVIVDMKGKAVV